MRLHFFDQSKPEDGGFIELMKLGDRIFPSSSQKHLILFFKYSSKFHKPRNFDMSLIDEGSCVMLSRLLLHYLGGSRKARIWWVNEERTMGGHAYVIKNGQKEDERPWNSYLSINYKFLNVRQVKELGSDVTDEFLKYKWSEC